jgi:hypothetical protein
LKKDKRRKGKKTLSMFVIVALLVVIGALSVYYRYMKKQQMQESVHTPTTETEKLIAKDLEVGYPETPKEVMKLFGRINQCIYNKTLDDSEFSSLVGQLRALYCEQLQDINTKEKMENDISEEKEQYKSKKRKIINYTIDEEQNYEYKTVEGAQMVYLKFSYFIRSGSDYSTVNWYAILVQEDDKWKIREFNVLDAETEEKKTDTDK